MRPDLTGRTYVEKSLSLFATHLSVGIAQNKPNGGEEVTLARAITTDNDIVFW